MLRSRARELVSFKYRFIVIGSVRWRLVNYGLSPTIKYLQERFWGSAINGYPPAEVSLEDFLKRVTGKESLGIIKSARAAVDSSLFELRESKNKMLEIENPIKPVLDEDTSVSRLIVLAAILEIFKIDTFIETGTQHGISASAVAKFRSLNLESFLIHSIDVGETHLVQRELEVSYITLERPVRRHFKEVTLNIANQKTLFFHDSDHTFENMYFEFNWAWNVLKVEILVADDIDMNNAYSKFCLDNSLPEFRIKMDSGTTIGVAIRNSSSAS
jgi:hypothetical protein